jgi:putative oxidoreductase
MDGLIARYLRFQPSGRASWYAVPLRLIVGFGFMEHGYAKLERGPETFTALGGLAVFVGALIPLASIPMAIVLVVAIVTAHLPNGFSSIKLLSFDAGGAHFGQPGYETDLLYLACLFALVLGGSGPLALDQLLFRRAKANGFSGA